MKEKNENNSLNEHIKRIKYRVNYVINESPKYRSLVNDNEEFDSVPDSIYATEDGQPVPNQGLTMREAGDQQPPEKPGGGEAPVEPHIDDPVGGDDAPVPAFDKTGGDEQIKNLEQEQERLQNVVMEEKQNKGLIGTIISWFK